MLAKQPSKGRLSAVPSSRALETPANSHSSCQMLLQQWQKSVSPQQALAGSMENRGEGDALTAHLLHRFMAWVAAMPSFPWSGQKHLLGGSGAL